MRYADYKKYDFLNGIGIRDSLFVSGCSHHCKDCFNKIAWDFNYGQEFTKKIQDTIIEHFKDPNKHIQGLSLLGGEPMDNTKGLVPFIKRFKNELPDKDIWVWSGYTYEQILKDKNKILLLKMCNILIDGKFQKDKKDLTLKFRGSSNQRIIDIQKSLKENKIILYDI